MDVLHHEFSESMFCWYITWSLSRWFARCDPCALADVAAWTCTHPLHTLVSFECSFDYLFGILLDKTRTNTLNTNLCNVHEPWKNCTSHKDYVGWRFSVRERCIFSWETKILLTYWPFCSIIFCYIPDICFVISRSKKSLSFSTRKENSSKNDLIPPSI